ncbi:hypothetical protein ACQUY5_27140 [Bacillus cereus]|uniref:hypothetical protein n=1 Tax=Bacillus cereus TaxID=1396 RepID=UPI003D186276
MEEIIQNGVVFTYDDGGKIKVVDSKKGSGSENKVKRYRLFYNGKKPYLGYLNSISLDEAITRGISKKQEIDSLKEVKL